MAIHWKTRMDISASYLGKVWVCFHGDDKEYAEEKFIPKLLKIKDCAVYYDGTCSGEQVPWDNIQIIVMLITQSTLTNCENDIKELIAEIRKRKTPFIPVLIGQDKALKALYEKVFGKIQRMNLSEDNIEKFSGLMESELDKYLADDDLREQVIRNFRQKIFLSYRSKDREQVQTLIRAIHKDEDALDIAVWYDVNLIFGKEYDISILEELTDADLFVLSATKGVLEKTNQGQDNYVVRIEIPEARKNGKDIIAVPLDLGMDNWQEQLGLNPAECTSIEDVCTACKETLGSRSLSEMTSSEIYLLGIAYLEGILAEKDPERGIRLLKAAAEEDADAIRKLIDIYFYGIGTDTDFSEALFWVNELQKNFYRRRENQEDISDEMIYFLNSLMSKIQELIDNADSEPAFSFAQKMVTLSQYVSNISVNPMQRGTGTIYEARGWSYLADAASFNGDPDKTLKYSKLSCDLLENMLKSDNPSLMVIRPVLIPSIITPLCVNYDHYADYLNRAGRTEEARMVQKKRNSLVSPGESDTSDFYAYVREADICFKGGNYEEAAKLLEKAVVLFDELNASSNNWKDSLQKATVLNKLAQAYYLDKNADEAALDKAIELINQADEVCNQIFEYDENHIPALRELMISLESLANIAARKGELTSMVKFLRLREITCAKIYNLDPSEQAREDIIHSHEHKESLYVQLWRKSCALIAHKCGCDESVNLPFSHSLQESRILNANISSIYVPGTFIYTRNNYDDWSLLSPTPGTLELIRELCPENNAEDIYSVPTRPVLRMIRESFIGEENNLAVNNIVAEMLIGTGNNNPLHQLVLYELVDSEYRIYYALFFSPAVLETKIAELSMEGLLPSDTETVSDGYFTMDIEMLCQFTDALAREHFGNDAGFVYAESDLPVFYADPSTFQPIRTIRSEQISDEEPNSFYFYLIQTDRTMPRPNLPF